MIEYYKIESTNNEDILYIYLNYDYEFGGGKKGDGILNQVKKTIKKSNFGGDKIVLMVGAIALATLLYTGGGFKGNIITESNTDYLNSRIVEKTNIFGNFNTENIEIQSNNENNSIEHTNNNEEVQETTEINTGAQKTDIVSNNSPNQNKKTETNFVQPKQASPSIDTNQNTTNIQPAEQPVEQKVVTEQPVEEAKTIVTVYRSSGIVSEIELQEYLIGVVAAEMPASFNVEALKAQAIVARTYTLKRMSRGLVLTDTVATQEYIDIDQMKTKWQGDFGKYYNKIKAAVDQTKGKYITYNGDYIDAVYHSTSNGYTEDSSYVWGNTVPYLKSVDSSWDRSASSYLRNETKDNNSILNILGITIDNNTPIEILSRNASGRIVSIRIGDSTYDGVTLRNLLGLRSTDFDISVQDGNLVFTTRGYGHGVGMSQYGANGMANSGYNYNQILTHYYQEVQIVG